MHAYKIQAAYERHVREMHAYEVHTHKVHAREIHAREMHPREIYAHEVIPMTCIPIRGMPMRCMSVRYTPMRWVMISGWVFGQKSVYPAVIKPRNRGTAWPIGSFKTANPDAIPSYHAEIGSDEDPII